MKDTTEPIKIIGRIINYLITAKTQEDIIEYLRSFNFVFMTYEAIMVRAHNIKLLNKHNKYAFMVRKLMPRETYDTRLIVGIKLEGQRVERIQIYHNGVYRRTIRKGWKDKEDINFRRIHVTLKFPAEFEDYDERHKWRDEHKKVLKNPKHIKSEFYKKWEGKVEAISIKK